MRDRGASRSQVRRRAVSAVAGGLALAVVAVVQGPTASADASLAPLVNAGAAGALPDQYIVVLDRNADRNDLDAVMDSAEIAGGTVDAVYRSALRGFSATLPPRALVAARSAPAVDYVAANVAYDLRDSVDPTGPDKVQPDATWGLDRSDQRKLPLDTKYRYRGTGAGVNAYIIDSGVRISHVDFEGRAEWGWDVVGDDPEAPDCFGHGTHVSGTVGSKTYGIAKRVHLVAINVCYGVGQTNAAYVIEGVDWVTEHAVRPAVANMSLGFPLGSAINEAVKGSIKTGITYVVAAGNSSGPACEIEPASLKLAITAGASDSGDRMAGFSSYGECVDLFAPGVSITSLGYQSDTATDVMSGTSMAAPHTTGVAALYLGRHPDATPREVARALKRQATDDVLSGLGPDSPNRLLYSQVR